jgi:hypothetical protein
MSYEGDTGSRSESTSIHLGRLVGWLLMGGGAVLAVAGYVGSRDSQTLLGDVAYLATGGITGVVLVSLGITAVVVADLARSNQSLEEVERWLAELKGGETVTVELRDRARSEKPATETQARSARLQTVRAAD